MHQPNRRRFLKQVGAVSAAATVAVPAYARTLGTAERISVGVIGCGGRGSGLLKTFGRIADVIHVCDPDEAHREKAKRSSGAKRAVSDLRHVLDDSSVDAVVIATPDHWHGPAAIMACEAGKQVYIEKPCSHNYRESRLLVEWPGDGTVGNRRQLIFEMRLWSTNYPYNCDSGAEFYGTEGRLFVSKRGKLEVYGQRNRRIEDAKPTEPVQIAGNHMEDFLDAIRRRRRPRADIAIAHDSVALVHLANIATRLGRSLQVDTKRETIQGDEEATRLLSRQYRDGGHWAIPKGV